MFSRKMVMIAGLIILITFSIIALSLSSRRPYLAYGPSRIAIAFVAPFQKIISRTTRFFADIWGHYFFLITVVDENRTLRNQLQQAKAANHQLQEAFLSNKRLQKLFHLQQQMQEPLIAAQVVGKDPSPWFQTVLLDKGVSDGIQKGRPVINPEGVVGIVVEVTNHFSKVMLITDPNSAVDAVIQNNRARGIIKGGGSGYCFLNFVLRKHKVTVGDSVVSSGMDGVFPKGLPIGQVAATTKHGAGIFQDVKITPYVDFERLEEVFIVQSTTPDRAS